MNRSRIKIRLLFCLIGHVALLLILAFYLQVSLRSVTKFTQVAHEREAELANLDAVPVLMRSLSDTIIFYHESGDPHFLDSISNLELTIHDKIQEAQASLAAQQLDDRRVVIQKWFTLVVQPVLLKQPNLDWNHVQKMSSDLLGQVEAVSEEERAIIQEYIYNLQNEENGVIEERVHLMWFLVGAVTFFTIIIQWMISNSIIDPIQYLEDVVKRIQAGDETVRAQLQTNDEIQTLAEAFNEMARKLLANRQELEQTNEQLERRVQEKTAELEEKNLSLQEAARLKDEFLATISHELRTPLTPILSCAYLLKSHPDIPEEEVQQVAVIERNAKALSHMIDELLDLSASINRKLTLHREWMDLVAWVRDTIKTLRPSLEPKKIKLNLHLPNQPILIHVDIFRLTQVLTNLVNNAVKFSDVGGEIDVELGSENGGYFVRVQDQGAGFEQSDIERIFEMFQQARTTRTAKIGGLGVGLTVARSLAELHGGRLTAHSSGPGMGAAFTLWLPMPPADKEVSLTKTAPKLRLVPSPLNGKHVLIIEDTPDTLASLQRIFERRGCQVHGFHSAEAAIAYCQQEPKIDVFLSDIGLPGITGAELISAIRQIPKYQTTVAIALSGLGRESDIVASLSAGFDAHLLKPIDIQNLEATIERISLAKAV